MKFIALLFTAVYLAGCTSTTGVQFSHEHSPEPSSEQAALSELSISVEYFDDSNHKISPKYQPKRVVLSFPHIPGQIFGSPTEKSVFVTPVEVGDRTVVSLDDAQRLLESQALTLKDVAMTKGLSVRPKDTKFSRVGTFPHDAYTSELIGGGGFIDPASRNNLILMYFDRPSRITGDVVMDGKSTGHAIDIPAAGFHWIEVKHTGRKQHTLIRRAPLREVVFSIYLNELIRM